MGDNITSESIQAVGRILQDTSQSLKERFRALFTLKNLGGPIAIEAISKCFLDPSSLLKHECAYCLGQMKDEQAIPILQNVIEDTSQEPIVRHEAGEALGAIGSKEVLSLLEKYKDDSIPEIAETCQLAIQRIQWLNSEEHLKEQLSKNPYNSVDPAPPSEEQDVSKLRAELLDEKLPLYARYRAMFALRNIGSEECVLALAEGLQCTSALFRHEVAFVLGQMAHPAASAALAASLREAAESSMVRHECAEALGSIATEQCMEVLREYAADSERVVRESCEIALDMGEHEAGDQFQYADSLAKVAQAAGV